MSRRSALAGALALVLALSGCATVPTSSTPVAVDAVGANATRTTLPAPASGQDPDLLVCAWVTASAAPAERHAAARQYLTPSGSKSWDDSASTTILDNVDCIPSGTDSARPGRTTVLLRGDTEGTLSATGAFTPASAPTRYTTTLDLVQVKGEWRIDSPPDGVVMRRADFTSVYRRVPVYFLDPTLAAVVPDLRWVVGDQSSIAARLVDLLLAGPRPDLAPAVVTELPPRASLRRNVAKADDANTSGASAGRGVVVDFAALDRLDPDERSLLAAQVVWTLDGAGVIGPYFLLVDGAPLDDAHPGGWTSSDVVSTNPAAEPGAAVPLHALREGALVQVDQTGVKPVPGALGGYNSLVSAAISRDGSRVAAVAKEVDGNKVALLLGKTGAAVVRAAEGRSMTRPTWSPDGTSVWVVQNGATVLRISQDARTGAVSTQKVDSTAVGAPPGVITSLRLSRDGVRAALVVGGVLELSEVVRSQSGALALSTPQPLAPALGAKATSVDFSAADTLVVSRSSVDRPVVTVTVDGSELRQLPDNNLTVPIRVVTASPGSTLVGDSRAVWQLTAGDATGQRTWRQVSGLGGSLGPTTVPVLPG
ncbi:MAG: MtrAB system accessory lipoprotein LpqB [Mycobacteriaceae bacterium]